MSNRWTCYSPITGHCGVTHRSMDTAMRHCGQTPHNMFHSNDYRERFPIQVATVNA